MASKKKIKAHKKQNAKNRGLTRSKRNSFEIDENVDPIGMQNGRNCSVKSVTSFGQLENVEKVVDEEIVAKDDFVKKSISNSPQKPKAKSTGFQLETKSLEQLSQTTELDFDSNKSDTMHKNAFTELNHNLENIENFPEKLNKLSVLPNILDTEDVEQSTVPTESVEVFDSLSFPKDFSFQYLQLLIKQEAKINKNLDICIKSMFCQLETLNAQANDLDLEADLIIRHLKSKASVDLNLIHIPLLYFFHYLKLKGQLWSKTLVNSMLDNYKAVIADRRTESLISSEELLTIYYLMSFHYRKLYPDPDLDPKIDQVFLMMISLIEPFFKSELFCFTSTSLGLFILIILCTHKLNLPLENRLNHIRSLATIKLFLSKVDDQFHYCSNPGILNQLSNHLFTSIVMNNLDSLNSMQNCDIPELLSDNLPYIGEILTSLVLIIPPNSIQKYLIYTFFQICKIISLESLNEPIDPIVFNKRQQYFQILSFDNEPVSTECIIDLILMINWNEQNDDTNLKCAIYYLYTYLSIRENFHPVSVCFMFVI